jgi:hypothetical protein
MKKDLNHLKEIREITHSLLHSLGKRPAINEETLASHFKEKKYTHLVSELKKHMGISCIISIKYHTGKLMYMNENGADVPAWVYIPEQMPLYKSKEYNAMNIELNIHEHCSSSFTQFMMIVTHELSHIVLHSLRNKYKMSEIATDIAAIVLGYGKFYEISHTRVNHEGIRRTGYLVFHEVIHVCEMVDEFNLVKRKNRIKKLLARIGL